MIPELTITLPAPEGSVWTDEAVDGLIGQHLNFHGTPGVDTVALCMEVVRGQIAEDDPTLAVVTIRPHLDVKGKAKASAAAGLRFKMARAQEAGLVPIGLTITQGTRKAMYEEMGGRFIEAGPLIEVFGLPIVGTGVDGVVV